MAPSTTIHPNSNPARVDVVLFTEKDGALHVAVHRRERDPFKQAWALPGGFVHEDTDDTLQDAAFRMLVDKLGVKPAYLEELGTFSGRHRDPRGWSMTVAFYAVVPYTLLEHNIQANGLALFPLDKLPALAFDHSHIVESAHARVKSKGTYSTLPMFLCGDTFTLSELQHAYEVVTDMQSNPENFQRKIKDMNVLTPVTGQRQAGARGRHAQLYRLKDPRPVLFNRSRGIF